MTHQPRLHGLRRASHLTFRLHLQHDSGRANPHDGDNAGTRLSPSGEVAVPHGGQVERYPLQAQ